MKRSLIAVLMIAVMLFAFAGVASAAGVERLQNLGIVEGDPSGDLRLDDTITRAEFAKIAVMAAGMGDAADLLKNSPTQFSDVKVGAWYTGWINVAATNGFVKGDPAGTFRPNDQVTYAEVVTVLLRVLGYDDNLPGSWPADYITKAASLGISKGVVSGAFDAAVRGDVFTMTDKALDEDVVTYDSENDEFDKKGVTLLEDSLDAEEVEGYVTANFRTDSKLDEDEIKIDGEKYTLKFDADVDALLGVKVTAKVDDDDILFVEVDTDEDDIMFDTVDGSNDDYVTLKVEDDDFDWAEDATVFVNFDKADVDDVKAGMYGKVVLEDGDVVFASFFDFTEFEAGLVTEADGEEFEYYLGADDKTLDFDDYEDGVFIFNTKMELVDVDEIKVNSVIYAWEDSDELYLIVVNEMAEGELDKIKTDEIKVDSDEFDVVSSTTASSNEDEDIEVYDIDGAAKDLLDSNVEVVLDINGDVRHLRGDSKSTSGEKYGILVDATSTSVTIFNDQGEEVEYYVEKRADAIPFDNYFDDVGTDGIWNYEQYLPVVYELNNDGEIEEGTLKVITEVSEKLSSYSIPTVDSSDVATNTGTVDFNEDEYIKFDGGYYYIGSDTLIIEFNKDKDDDPNIVDWADIEDSTSDTVELAVVGTEGKDADFVVIYGDYSSVGGDDTYYAVVTDYPSLNRDEDWEIELDVFENDDIEDGWFVLEKAEDEKLFNDNKANLVEFKLTSDDEIKDLESANVVSVDSVAKTVYDVDGKYIEFTDGSSMRLQTDTVVYTVDEDGEVDKAKRYSDIDKGDKIVYIADGNFIKAALIVNEYVDAGSGEGGSTATGDYTVVKFDVTNNLLTLKDADDNIVAYILVAGTLVELTDGTVVAYTDAAGILDANDTVNITLVQGTDNVSYIKIVTDN